MSHPLVPHGPAPHGGPGRAVIHARTGAPASPPARARTGLPTDARTGDPARPRSRGADLRLPAVVGLAALAGVVHLALTDPYRPGGHLVCPVLALTGFYCAGCGGQRAVHELAHLDLAAAWAMNPLVVLAAPVAILAWARWVRRRWRHAPPGPAASSTLVPWVLIGVVVAFAVLRNVPALAPWLAP